MILPRTPQDAVVAFEHWGASCGPAALAAALGLSLAHVREAVCRTDDSGQTLPFRGHMGAKDMLQALERLPVAIERIEVKRGWSHDLDLLAREGTPRVVLVQWEGPWESHPKRAAAHRHWIANVASRDETWIYDVNADDWILFERWRDELVPTIQPARATGWRCAWAAAVKLR